MRRRAFIAGLGGAAAWPLAAQAQQRTKPIIGFLDQSIAAPRREDPEVDAFWRGWAEVGFLRDRDVTIDYRTTAGHPERLPELAADLVRQPIILAAARNNVPAVYPIFPMQEMADCSSTESI